RGLSSCSLGFGLGIALRGLARRARFLRSGRILCWSRFGLAFFLRFLPAAVLARVVGHVPSGALELEGRARNQLRHLAFAGGTAPQRLFRDALRDLEGSASLATVLVDGHRASSNQRVLACQRTLVAQRERKVLDATDQEHLEEVEPEEHDQR